MREKLLGRRTGLRVSELALGCGLLGMDGDRSDPAEARRTLTAFADKGGTFIDTSSFHQGGQAEEMVGSFLAEAGRDRFVISTKYGRPRVGDARTSGANRVAMTRQVEDSLRRLNTDRIELYAVEFPDGVTPLDEIMRGLEALVRDGKVLAVALSNFPAWKTAWAAAISELHGRVPVAAIHQPYSLVERAVEREHLPMAEALGMAVLAWSPQARGRLARTPPDPMLPEAVRTALAHVATELDATTGAVALAWLLARGVFPVVGARNASQLAGALTASGIELGSEHLRLLREAMPYSDTQEPLLARMRALIGISGDLIAEAVPGAAMSIAS